MDYKKNAEKYIELGVEIRDVASTYIDDGVVIGAGTVIYPNNHLLGNTVIGKNVVIMPNNIITDSEIADNTEITASVLKSAKVGVGTKVGPNAYLRPNAVIGENCRIGDFVEIKNSNIGNGTKISHLTYVGDADVGKTCNIGCGVVFVNYDGKNKYRSAVGNNCFIGSNCNLVAPVTVEDNCFIAAGTTVTKDYSKDSFVIGRVRDAENEKLAKKFIGDRRPDSL